MCKNHLEHIYFYSSSDNIHFFQSSFTVKKKVTVNIVIFINYGKTSISARQWCHYSAQFSSTLIQLCPETPSMFQSYLKENSI